MAGDFVYPGHIDSDDKQHLCNVSVDGYKAVSYQSMKKMCVSVSVCGNDTQHVLFVWAGYPGIAGAINKMPKTGIKTGILWGGLQWGHRASGC